MLNNSEMLFRIFCEIDRDVFILLICMCLCVCLFIFVFVKTVCKDIEIAKLLVIG